MITQLSFGQTFEGEIVYQNVYKSKIPNLSDEKFTTLMGSTQDYFIKEAEYRSNANGTLLQWQIYVPADNRLYTKMSNSESALWNDAAINPDSINSVALNRKTVEILGYPCDELVLNCKTGIQKYYFNSKLSIDSKKYVNHKFGNWYTYVSNANAVPLKFEIDNAQFTLTATAIEVKPMKLDDRMFQLPNGIGTSKAPD